MEKVLYWGYIFVGSAGYLLLRLLLPVLRKFDGKYCFGIAQRLGEYDGHVTSPEHRRPRIWLHASSVGEVNAAEIVLGELLRTRPDASYVLTTTTRQGNIIAQSRLPKQVTCLMAPIDAPAAVRKALRFLSPDFYICLETELWPVMLTEIRRTGVRSILLNGRISERSFQRYMHVKKLMAPLLAGFERIAAITADDARRFAELGATDGKVSACGNLKVAAAGEKNPQTQARQRELLMVGESRVFICGSTHNDEEEQLLAVYRRLRERVPVVWLIAPRHLERVGEVTALLKRSGLGFDLYSSLLVGQKRSHDVVVVDTMGDLADIYSVGDFVFCGGSLVDRGGHNLMEVTGWGRPVYYGPSIFDFEETAAQLERAGCGFRVRNAEELSELLLSHTRDAQAYEAACREADNAALHWGRALTCQVGVLAEVLQAPDA